MSGAGTAGYGINPRLKRSDMARDNKGIAQFYLPPTHKPYLPQRNTCTGSLPIKERVHFTQLL